LAEIVSFYSYKGGVGRSLSLANVAALLASRGKRVVCIDFDLEAGGLHTIFGFDASTIKYTLLDLLIAIRPPDVSSAVIDVYKRLQLPVYGQLLLLPTVSETDKVKKALGSSNDLTMLLGSIVDRLVYLYNPNYVLIDSRSGFAELASASILKADRLACVLRPNRQNAEGLKMLFDILEALPSSPATFLILSQVPELPETAARIEKLEAILGPNRKFGAQIPYSPQLALEENVVAITSPKSSLADTYTPIVDWMEGAPS
jgi:MinD-like ATPase involved in chromosome partitioning or flagellar assembly